MVTCDHCGAEKVEGKPFCPACGRLSSGMKSQVEVRKGCGPAAVVLVVVGAGLIAGLFVVGIIAAIAIPNFLNAVDRAKQKRTLADIKTWSKAIEAYKIDTGMYPTGASLQDLSPHLGSIAAALSSKDGWNRDVHYGCWNEDPKTNGCDHYWMASPGKDGVFQHDDGREYSKAEVHEFNCDLVLVDGSFVQWPERLQQ